MRIELKAIFTLCTIGMVLTGCGNTQSAPNKPKPVSHKNGTIASMKKITVKGQNPNISIYKMYYWSQGQKVEAFVTEPKNSGSSRYPLLVNCHGGLAVPSTVKDYPSPVTLQAVASSTSNLVTVIPQYRGYQGSAGTVHGILGDTVDTENAIMAADSLKMVNPNVMYAQGTSMGGGVVLMLDSNPAYSKSLRFVVATSPFVGWEVENTWAKQHPSDTLDNQRMVSAESFYGPFSATSSAYIKRSPDISRMAAPVLLLQGTVDSLVTWQTVQQFANEMKAQHKTVKLVLVPGGDHGLQNHPQAVSKNIAQWYKQYQ